MTHVRKFNMPNHFEYRSGGVNGPRVSRGNTQGADREGTGDGRMSEVLWNLARVQERMAAAMWRGEARRAASTSIAKARTPDAFRQISQGERDRWMGLADVALEAILRTSE